MKVATFLCLMDITVINKANIRVQQIRHDLETRMLVI